MGHAGRTEMSHTLFKKASVGHALWEILGAERYGEVHIVYKVIIHGKTLSFLLKYHRYRKRTFTYHSRHAIHSSRLFIFYNHVSQMM